MNRWRAKGYTTTRSAGSHGPWDVCAVMNNRPVALIQCKIVATETIAKRLHLAWMNDPPFAPSDCYHQVLEIRIKGDSTVRSITV